MKKRRKAVTKIVRKKEKDRNLIDRQKRRCQGVVRVDPAAAHSSAPSEKPAGRPPHAASAATTAPCPV